MPLIHLVGATTTSGTVSATVTLTRRPSASGLLQLFTGIIIINTNSDIVDLNPVSDSKGGTWNRADSGARVGSIFQGNNVSPHANSCTFNAAVRTSGSALDAGDTVSFTFDTPHPAQATAVIQIVDFLGVDNVVIDQKAQGAGGGYGPQWTNTDQYPSFGTSATRRDWVADFGPGSYPQPFDTGWMIGVALSMNEAGGAATGFVPDHGAVIHESVTSPITMTTFSAPITAGVALNPSGQWPAPSTMLMANFQFAFTEDVVPTGVFATPRPFRSV